MAYVELRQTPVSHQLEGTYTCFPLMCILTEKLFACYKNTGTNHITDRLCLAYSIPNICIKQGLKMLLSLICEYTHVYMLYTNVMAKFCPQKNPHAILREVFGHDIGTQPSEK